MKIILIILPVFFISFITLSAAPVKNNQDFNIDQFGAVGGGNILNTVYIQQAIDKAYEKGGGTVTIPKGIFLSGSIILKSHVNLRLLKGATLLGSTNPFDYRKISDHNALILADSSDNISITGQGTIDEQGLQLALALDSLYHAGKITHPKYNTYRMRPPSAIRPDIINFNYCRDVKVKNVTIKNGAGWVTKYGQCENLTIDGVKIISTAYWNNDGMDICDCRNVRITNCFVNSADDGICLKSYSPENYNDSIYIYNCVIRSSASAIKLGTDSRGGFKNIRIKKIKIYDTFRSAIAIESVDGGIIDSLYISDIQADNTGNAIFIRLGHRNSDEKFGMVKNIFIKNIKVTVPFGRPDIKYDIRGPALPFFHNTFPASITGIPGHDIENVTLSNIEITYPGRGTKGMAYIPLSRLEQVPEKKSDYPEFSMFGELPAWGLYVRHVNGLTLKNIKLNVEAKDYRPAYVFDEAENIKVADSGICTGNDSRQLVLDNVSAGIFENIKINSVKECRIIQLGNCKSISIK